MHTVVLLRHGQSTWNLENRFTGWTDVPLTERGTQEAANAGKKLRDEGFIFDAAHTNYLKRAIKTTWLVLEQMDLMWIPISTSWRLNEKHYGALQGLNKSEIAKKYGEEQVMLWRRSYDVSPPEISINDDQYPGKDPRYQNLTSEQMPRAESLESTLKRVLPYWEATIVPQIQTGKRLLISASGNSLRALVKHLSSLSPEQIVEFNIPTGIPLIYELDDQLQPTNRYFLATGEELANAINEVKNQGKA